jgi:hypothetical protein
MNIFYDNVDANLQGELNMRGKAGMQDRTNKSLNFMLGKIANVQCTAYEGTGSASAQIKSSEFGILGGATTTYDRYLPSGPNGFLTTRELERTQTSFYKSKDDPDFIADALDKKLPPPEIGAAYTQTLPVYVDTSKRIGPYLTSIDVTIGDHSMGLLNKASISFMIPNAERDLDAIENTWFHPGRFVKLDIVHPDSAIISKDDLGNNGLLLETTVPNIEKLSKLYPGIKDIVELQSEIRRMNIFTFEGLITSFEFSYTPDGGVEASLQLTGTSNVYADISMYLPDTPAAKAAAEAAKEAAGKINSDPALGTNNFTVIVSSSIDPTTKKVKEFKTIETGSALIVNGINAFYAALDTQFNAIAQNYITTNRLEINSIPIKLGEADILTQYYSSGNAIGTSTDQYILAGKMYDIKSQVNSGPLIMAITNPTASVATASIGPQTALQARSLESNPVGSYERYITLGALIQFINDQIFIKYPGLDPNQKKPIGIIHTDAQQYSNYYERLTSCIPHKILFLPADPQNRAGMNWHGDLGYYRNSVNNKTKLEVAPTKPWPGVHASISADLNVMYPSRIFINLTRISEIASQLGSKNLKTFTVSAFLSAISSDIGYASGGAISLKLVSDKNNLSQLIFTDTSFLKSIDPDTNKTKLVRAYSVPMFANHKFGSVVRDFKFNATLPESAKNLSYVLNSGDKVTNDQIAPYMNFMYNSNNPTAINEAIAKYKARHLEILDHLYNAKKINGEYPYSWLIKDTSGPAALYKALSDYIKMPTDDIQKSQQITAPIFPFTTEFTIDGINGLRYGDVLTFEALPLKYRVNTVFSVISVTHTVSTTGEWTTAVKCIMRPSIS